MMVVKSKTKKHNKSQKTKGTKKCVIKRILKFDHFEDCLFNKKPIQPSKQRFKCEAHNVYTEPINKITLSSNDDKRLQTFHRNTTDPDPFKVCKSEMLIKYI